MRELGHDLCDFDLSVPGVSSFMTDGHKLGQLPVATGFFLIRDASLLEAVPLDWTFIHTLTATKPGDHAATAWAVMRHLGRAGYRAATARLLESVRIVVEGIEAIDELRLMVKPLISVINFTSDTVDMEQVFNEISRRGWGSTFGHVNGPRPHPPLAPSLPRRRPRPRVRAGVGGISPSREVGALASKRPPLPQGETLA